jgi:hypothetical protein
MAIGNQQIEISCEAGHAVVDDGMAAHE